MNHTQGLVPSTILGAIDEARVFTMMEADNITFQPFGDEKVTPHLEALRSLISDGLSEPYSIYVYRYFLHQWGDLCYLALDCDKLIGVVICKLEKHREHGANRGYIAMLVVKEEYRGRGLATKLVKMAIDAMIARDADEVVLETEVTNTSAIKLYEHLGFLRSKRLHRYYLNGNSAFRLVLYLKTTNNVASVADRVEGEVEMTDD
ncbi:N-alpha-acetyltransferase mak3 [Orbilia brochopaga]|uniref:N-alpha-acetyltransferase mak3 n=1 Tax=Orbilia brochopaga TaxID=3140254 RepID=A0AAV9UJK6_9PEZI